MPGRRVQSITEQNLREHFHLPLHTVAQKFGMCTTAFKKMCRRLGIAKWPHRQLRGIDKKIAALKAELNYAALNDRHQYVAGIQSLEEEKAKLSHGMLIPSLDSSESDCEASRDYERDEEKQTPPPRLSVLSGNDASDDEDMGADYDGNSDSCFKSEKNTGASTLMISERDLRQNFHLPLHTAAQKFGICTTAFKKLCRRFGIAKWPHRQLRGIDKKIAALKAELNYTTGDREVCCKSLKALREEKLRISRSSGDKNTGAWSLNTKDVFEMDQEQKVVGKDRKNMEKAQTNTPTTKLRSKEEMECASALSMLAAVAGFQEENEKGSNFVSRGSLIRDLICESSRISEACSTDEDMGNQGEPHDTPPLEPIATLTPPYKYSRIPPIVPNLLNYSPCV
eukprot:748843-Hanusia_phi.AAC.1